MRTQSDGNSLRKAYGESSFNRLVRQYKSNAKRRGFSFKLSNKQVRNLTSLPCTYCGKEPSQVMQDKESYGPYIYTGIDRMDSSKGYIRSNCTSSCKDCNGAKSNMSYPEWVLFLQRISKFQGRINGRKETTATA